MKLLLRRAALLAATLGLAVGAVGSAGAQVSRALTVAVLTFTNSSGVGGAVLASTATAAVESQLIESGRYDVVKKDLVNKTMSDLTLTPPLGRLGITQLAQALEADDIITGDVQRVTRDPKTNQVRVTLRLEMTDRASGELSNGAIATGESGIRPDFTGAQDVLLDEAVNKAAFASVRSMNERILPEGTVFATSTREGQIEALLNIGSNSGVRSGMEFIVLRNREQVGRIRVTSVTPTDATAAVIATTRGVQPEDKVRAIFRLENIPPEVGGTGESAARITRPKTNLGNLGIGILALAGLVALNHGHAGTGTPGPRDVHAYPSGPFNGAPVSDVLPEAPSVHVTWRPPLGVTENDVIGYEVFTDRDTVNPLDLLDHGTHDAYISGMAVIGSFHTTPASPLDIANSVSSGPDIGRPLRMLVRSAFFRRDTGSTTGGGTTGGGTTGGGTTGGTSVSLDDVYTGLVTFLVPPLANSAPVSDVSAVPFSFQTVPGGDYYVIQISKNPQFTNAITFPQGSDGFYYPPAPNVGPLTIVTGSGSSAAITGFNPYVLTGRTDPTYTKIQTLNVSAALLSLGITDIATEAVYWRVGVRDSRDALRPENGGYVWGTPVQLGGSAATPVAGRIKTAPTAPIQAVPVTPGAPIHQPTPGDIRATRPGKGRPINERPGASPASRAGR